MIAIIFLTIFIHLIISFSILIEFESNYTSGVSLIYTLLCFIPIVNIILYVYYKINYDL